MKDYYSILGINSSAKYVEIRKAYRKRALELHPDVNISPKAKEDFVEVNEAYRVLKNVHSRARYDKLRNSIRRKAENQFDLSEERRNQRRSEAQNKRSEEGRKRGERESKKSTKQFKKKTTWSGIADIFGFLVEILGIFG